MAVVAAEGTFDHRAIVRIGEPEEIAAAVAFLASDDAANIAEAGLVAGGGILLGTVR